MWVQFPSSKGNSHVLFEVFSSTLGIASDLFDSRSSPTWFLWESCFSWVFLGLRRALCCWPRPWQGTFLASEWTGTPNASPWAPRSPRSIAHEAEHFSAAMGVSGSPLTLVSPLTPCSAGCEAPGWDLEEKQSLVVLRSGFFLSIGEKARAFLLYSGEVRLLAVAFITVRHGHALEADATLWQEEPGTIL